jgi:hypothetical protein
MGVVSGNIWQYPNLGFDSDFVVLALLLQLFQRHF